MSDVNLESQGFDDILKELKRIKEELEEDNYVLVGMPNETGSKIHQDSKLNNATIAAIHEFGAPEQGIPERSFLRAGLEQNKNTLSKAAEKAVENAIDGKADIAKGMDAVGSLAAASVKKYISEGIAPPLKKPRKTGGSEDKPLIDTGELRSSITWVLASSKDIKEGI